MRTAAAGTGAAAVGVGSTQTRFSPVQNGEAIAPLVAGLAGLAVGAYAGARVVAEWADNSRESDFSDADDQQAALEIWSTVDSIDKASQSGWRDAWNSWRLTTSASGTHEDNPVYVNSVNGTDGESAYLNAAWSEIRSALASSIENGDDASTAKINCRDALDIHTTRAAINLIEATNAQISSFSEELVEDLDRGLGLFTLLQNTGEADNPLRTADESNITNGSAVVTDSDGNLVVGSTPVDHFPADLEDVPGADPEATYEVLWVVEGSLGDPRLVPGVFLSDSYNTVTAENNNGSPEPFAVAGAGPDGGYGSECNAVGIADQAVEDFGPVWALPALFEQASIMLSDQYTQARSDISDYVDSAYAAYEAGDLDTSELLTSADIVGNFSDANTTSRVTAELAASGFLTPENIKDETQITVRHPDIENGDGDNGNERTGLLYLQTDADLTVSEGNTIAAADYESAYLVYMQEDGGGNVEYTTDILSGSSDLEILEIHSDETELNYTQWVENTADPTDTSELQAQIDKVTQLRDEIEHLREEIANENAGGVGGFLDFGDSGSQLGIIALGAAVFALLWGGSSGN